MDRPAGLRTCLHDTAQSCVIVDNMARKLAGLLSGGEPAIVVGILRRGAPLADRIVDCLRQHPGVPLPLRVDLKVKRYADDLTLLHPETQLSEDERQPLPALEGRTLVVVDDVLFTGHSLLRVVEHLARRQPARILVAVLVDRGVACLPVHADVAGVRLDIAAEDIIECNVPPYEPDFRIELLQPRSAA